MRPASSFHLFWDFPDAVQASEVSVGLEIVEPPVVNEGYFWALQCGFALAGGRRLGAFHLGLQWWPGYRGRTAVNFGGYQENGRELPGTKSVLASDLGNSNTRNYSWAPGRQYLLRIRSGLAAGRPGWEGSVVDLANETETVVRTLFTPPSDVLIEPVVWSEVFARCTDPPVEVAWSNPTVVEGSQDRCPRSLTVNYQPSSNSGCTNTNSWVEDDGAVHQRTNCARETRQGSSLPLR